MLNIDDESMEAEREQKAEEVRKKIAELPARHDDNIIKLSLTEYLEMYDNAVNYCKLLNVLKDATKRTKWDSFRIDESKLFDGLKAIDGLTYTAITEAIENEED
jgi:hypothetical protein